ncbi:MAG: SoxR reducing system RseC family protein [Clostridia bacterium]|nr:SoxR reducing system RseC family protein [Clostridia bacterium]
MIQKGKVISLDGEYAVVEVMRTSGCVGCSKQEGCVACKKKIKSRAYNKAGAKVGDTVTLESRSDTVLAYALVVFVLPLVLTIAAYLLSGLFFSAQLPQILVSTCIFVLTYVIIYFTLDRRPEVKKSVKITKID